MIVQRSKEATLQAIKGSLGIVSTIARRLQCESRTAKKLIDKWEETREAFESEKEFVLDLAENGLYDALLKKEQWAVKFILSTKGQSRGYVQTTEIRTAGDPLNINLGGIPMDAKTNLAAGNVEMPDYGSNKESE